MNHKTIKKQHIIDKYILGELSDTQVADFENHLVECQKCFLTLQQNELIVAATMQAAGEGVLKPKHERPLSAWSRFTNWFDTIRAHRTPIIAFGAIVLLLIVFAPTLRTIIPLGDLAGTLNEYSDPHVISGEYTLDNPDRAKTIFVAEKKNIILNISIPQTIQADLFQIEILSQNGKVVWSQKNVQPQQFEPIITIVCNTGFFKDGEYTLNLQDSQRSYSLQYPLKILFQ